MWSTMFFQALIDMTQFQYNRGQTDKEEESQTWSTDQSLK